MFPFLAQILHKIHIPLWGGLPKFHEHVLYVLFQCKYFHHSSIQSILSSQCDVETVEWKCALYLYTVFEKCSKSK